MSTLGPDQVDIVTEQALRGGLLDRSLGSDVLLKMLEGSYRSGCAGRDLVGDVEVQVHGGVSMVDDVEAIVLDPSFGESSVERDIRTAAARYSLEVAWHDGSEIKVDGVPDDFRGPTMPGLASRVAREDGIVDAQAIGVAAATERFEEPTTHGDPHESPFQQLKYLWHTLLAHGRDAPGRP